MPAKKEETLVLRADLKGKAAQRFLALKDKLAFESNADLVRLLISRAYEEEFGRPIT